MPRPRAASQDDILKSAMNAFWHSGFEATSMADLVAATGSTRQSIYSDFGSKDGLFRACFDLYRDEVVLPAIAPLSNSDGGMEAIAQYFETQIARAEALGMPGPGCLVGNAMIETAPGDEQIRKLVEEHNERLASAFAGALREQLPKAKRRELADFLVVAAQGLWAISRVTSSAATLRTRAKTIVRMIQKEIEDVI